MALSEAMLKEIERLKKNKNIKITIYADGYAISPANISAAEAEEIDKGMDEFIALIEKNEKEFATLPPERQKEILESRKNFESRERAFMECQDWIVQNKL